MTDQPDQEATTPAQTLELYLETRRDEVQKRTLDAHRYRLQHFVRWCEQEGIEDTNSLTPRHLHEFRLWRRDDGDLNTVSLHTQLSTLRVFLKFCGNIGVVDGDLFDKLIIPSMDPTDDRRERKLSAERAQKILDWLYKYEYASFDHIVMHLLWNLGLRIGGLRSLDLEDYDSDSQQLRIQHRPETDTPIKNGNGGERVNAISEETCSLIDDYINQNRYDITDKNGRASLLTTNQGRPSTSTIRRHVYRCTQPCQRGECPHDVDEATCEAKGYKEKSGSCPSILRPHDIRRGMITHWLQNDVPKEAVGDRADVKEGTLDKHYDQRDEVTKAEQRRKFLDDI